MKNITCIRLSESNNIEFTVLNDCYLDKQDCFNSVNFIDVDDINNELIWAPQCINLRALKYLMTKNVRITNKEEANIIIVDEYDMIDSIELYNIDLDELKSRLNKYMHIDDLLKLINRSSVEDIYAFTNEFRNRKNGDLNFRKTFHRNLYSDKRILNIDELNKKIIDSGLIITNDIVTRLSKIKNTEKVINYIARNCNIKKSIVEIYRILSNRCIRYGDLDYLDHIYKFNKSNFYVENIYDCLFTDIITLIDNKEEAIECINKIDDLKKSSKRIASSEYFKIGNIELTNKLRNYLKIKYNG